MPSLYFHILFQAWQKYKQFPRYKQALHILLKAELFITWREDNLILVLLVDMEIMIKVISPSFYLESFLCWRITASVWISRSCWCFRGQKAKPSSGTLTMPVTAEASSGRHGVTTEPGDMGFHPGSAIAQQWVTMGLGCCPGSLCLSFPICNAKGTNSSVGPKLS